MRPRMAAVSSPNIVSHAGDAFTTVNGVATVTYTLSQRAIVRFLCCRAIRADDSDVLNSLHFLLMVFKVNLVRWYEENFKNVHFDPHSDCHP